MPVHHVALFRWKDSVGSGDIARIDAALAALPAQIPSLRGYHHGADLGLGGDRWDYGIVAEFDDADGWRTYDQHPAHQQVIADLIRPSLAARAAVQIGR